jgi:hypothetical protein
MSELQPPPPPSATPQPAAGGSGCLLLVIGVPLVILIGLVVGTILNRPDDAPEEKSVTVAEGTVGDTRWRVDAVRDVEGDICAFLYQDDEQLTGGCSLEPDDATFGDRTVVFGRAPIDDETVQVELSDGRTVEIETETVEGIEGRFYAEVVDGDIDAEGLG